MDKFADAGLLIFNLCTDADDSILGFTTQWIRVLAARVRLVHVLTMKAGKLRLADNVRVYSVGKEKNYSEVRRAAEFYRILFRLLSTEQIDGCFSHMMPLFSAMGGPLLRLKRIPLVTWYAHPSATFVLKAAHRLSHQMITSLPRAYPYRKDKVTVIGQGIDTALFALGCEPEGEIPLILCAGRLSPVKDHPTLLRAAALLKAAHGQRFRLVILGALAGGGAERYVAGLHRLVEELGLSDIVAFEKPVPPGRLADWYRRCTVHVNLTPAGFGDKVAWEAMSCGRPCLVANEDFKETLGEYHRSLLFRYQDPHDLADKIGELLRRNPEQRDRMGLYLRSRVEALHSLDRLADRILEQLNRFSARNAFSS